ncbi:MAG: flavodoxin-dependent (E)-4-hydroxy-3-methylbut-2-enyl-diphosphate synthase [Dehalococcoidales bacterium]|jgi:(E)-4-hydroxy-3-methylbut-2-enyl-diphosphate synthase|nr:flavodoxin-dependent (E)-4-hydroxy-3-methylbut-2-enyl-diphosphate synthase [Dehalococcoidales bacterium]MDP7110161.1 flavodoxin-dependent (E)-4-hydroxy-3-methylbut-2-enyl-diphosphate synthase [Dehalococcoidales bacterium]MDP7309669.1 flavodoxin-dependent (E)-4-hydroxy-3-methylbut-2-enyl-diphosphate synthase [Dehalococcoidales bacterium]MDP7409398.1 flavodoxin-dependent (E)-4-hydroxy-3-methylbut-2-enyl-diphosphate synthase [Dehalococcoidales bacterium]MDP7675733.1 flavodoxin-dependent (E)-4-h|tara:strand:- start:1395 stop:2441 length:1047 start_codon:yes stop_codon:yes gene_type:complete
MDPRRISKPIKIGDVTIGGGARIIVQSMTNTDTSDTRSTIYQIKQLEECGCEVIRVAVPDMQAAQALAEIKERISIPLIADIHFDYRLALAALKAGVDGLRLNPGNIGEPERVKMVVLAAKERKVPIRIGLNAGSLPKNLDPKLTTTQKMVAAALEQVKLLESLDFDLIKLSLKAFDVPTTIEAYREIAARTSYPLHIGITEAGTPRTGVFRSSIGIGTLLYMGIGDTIRVSLTAHPREEVFAGYEILKSLNLRQHGPILVSCPSCGRTEVNIIALAETVEKELAMILKPIKVAVMGCIVNGPDEAMDADIGIACGKGRGVLFRRGEKIGVVEEKDFLTALMQEVEKL